MLRLVSQITIEGDKTWQFSAIAKCTIVEDIESLTDTCELELPRNITWEESTRQDGKPPIKRGDKIEVKLGYYPYLVTRFEGYVRSVHAQVPVVIKCEDPMFLLKQRQIKPKSWKVATLDNLIAYLLEGTTIQYQLIDQNLSLGKYRITKGTVAAELQELKEHYMLSSYFRRIGGKNILYIGLAYPTDNRNKVRFAHGKNIITEEFEYRRKEDIRARVQAVSFGKKHKKVTVEIGDKDGDLIKIRIDGLSETELKKYAQQSLDRYKRSGFKGSFETFGEPMVTKSDMLDILASDDNQGVYLSKRIETTFGKTTAYRQNIELGQPLSIGE